MPPPLRVLVLSKRQYMGRDLIDDRYGRFRELPLGLARLGEAVRGLCLSYRTRPEGESGDAEAGAAVAWTSLGPSSLLPRGRYWREVDRLREVFRPDLVWAGSDVLHAALGVRVARRLGVALAIDLYDNFESYPLARLPGVTAVLRRAVLAADAVSCISAPLAHHVREQYGYRGPIEVVENAIPAGSFAPGDRAAARSRLGLPGAARLIGTAGSLSPTRGIQCLFDAFERLAAQREDVHLVLAGPLDADLSLPRHPRVHYLGSLPPGQVPTVLAALDVSVICNRDSEFGRYCFPQKLYESVACGVPVVVASVGAMAELLSPFPENLFRPEDADSLLAALQHQLDHGKVPALEVPSWDRLASKLRALFGRALAERPAGAA